jgi:hypothetical protein
LRLFFEEAGDVASLDVLSALCAVGRGGASGEVRFTGRQGESVRYGFDQGVLVSVETPPANSPSETLIRAGKIQRATYEALTVGDFEDRFAVAVASGVISRREAAWGIKIAAIETLASVAASAEGSYTFTEGVVEPMQPSFRLPVDHWVLELFLRSGDRSFVLRKIGATDIPIARVDGFAEGFAALGLTADADAVVEGIDGHRTIEKVVKHSRADEFATLKLLGALMTLGLIHPILEAPREALAPADELEPSPSMEPEARWDDPAALPPGESALAPFPRETESFRGSATPAGETEPGPDEDSTAVLPTSPHEMEPDVAPSEPEDGPIGSFSGVSAEDEVPERAFPAITPAEIPEPPVVNLPLFALTAPEDPALDMPAESPALDTSPAGGAPRGIRPWAIAGVAAAILIAAILFVRRPRPGNAVAPPPASPPAAPAKLNEPAPETAAPKESPRNSSPRDIVVSRAPLSRPAPPPASKGEPATGPGGDEKWAQLAEAGRREMEHPGTHRYSIQLELACESSTLEKAFTADPGRRHLWIAPYSFRGRRCYRVLWGKFADLASARGARGAVPALFARDGNRPTVVALGPAAGEKRRR